VNFGSNDKHANHNTAQATYEGVSKTTNQLRIAYLQTEVILRDLSNKKEEAEKEADDG
jgi:hypothetical protein